MLWDIFNTLLEFVAIYLLFYMFSGMKVFDRNLLSYLPVSMVLSMFFCADIPHYVPVNLLLFVVAQLICFRNIRFGDRLHYAVSSVLVIISLELVLLSFLPQAFFKTFLGDSMVNIVMIILISGVFIFVRKYEYSSQISGFIKRYFIPIIVVLVLWSVLAQWYMFQWGQIWQYIPGFISLAVLLAFMIGIIIDVAYRKSEEHKQVVLYQEKQKVIDLYIETLRKENHDYKHQLNYINQMVNTSENVSELQSEISEYTADISAANEITDSILGINDTLYKAVLFGAYIQCQNDNIQFSFSSSDMLPAFPIKDFQLVEVLENLISNAIEYCRTLDQSDRWIDIVLWAEGEENKITISNTYSEKDVDITRFGQKGFTTKKEEGHMGIGLSIVQELLKENKISFYVKRDEEKKTISFVIVYPFA